MKHFSWTQSHTVAIVNTRRLYKLIQEACIENSAISWTVSEKDGTVVHS